jgi:mono/diheme cytochrome c family protein
MKAQLTILPVAAMLAASITLFSTGCGDSEPPHDESHMEVDHHQHAPAEHDHAAGEHSHAAGGHMQHMDEVRAWLKEELKDQYDQPVPAVTAAMLAQGKEVYGRTCVTCHGASGKGDGPAAMAFEQKPADFTDAAHSKYYSDAGRILIIEKGVEGTPMTGWANILSADEIHAVYGYVRSLRETPDDVVATDGAYACPMHPEITSDQPGKCSKCGMNLVLKDAPHDHGEHAD